MVSAEEIKILSPSWSSAHYLKPSLQMGRQWDLWLPTWQRKLHLTEREREETHLLLSTQATV